jgi:peroxiredoxin
MSNGLTGDYEVAVEVSVAAVNRILATLHQQGMYKEASPKFLHSITARVGEVPKSPKFELLETFLAEALGADGGDLHTRTLESLSAAQGSLLEMQKALTQVTDNLSKEVGSIKPPKGSTPAPPTIALAHFPWLYLVRGWVKAQLSTLTITLPENSTSEVTVHCQTRAHYTPDPGTAALPTPIHGEVQVTFEAKYHPTGTNGANLEVKVTDEDSKILFVPAAGTALTATEAKLIARQIRRWIRTKFEPMKVDLPDGFPFRKFKNLGTGNSQAIALPFNPSGAKIPAFADFPSFFLESSDDYAIAIKANFVNTQLQPALGAMAQYSDQFTIGVWVPAPPPWFYDEITATYQVSVSTPSIVWHTGKVTVTVNGTAKTSSALPNYFFGITQDFTLHLDQANQKVSLQPIGDLSISGNLPDAAENKAKQKIKSLSKAALTLAQGKIEELMDGISFNDALKPFDAAAKATYTSIEVQPAGVILRGGFTASHRPEVVAEFSETPDGTGWTAFKSWIPAGNIEKYVWSWVRPDPSSFLPSGGIEEQVSSAHDFIFRPKPISQSDGTEKPSNPPWHINQVCLRVEGKQIGSKPGIESKFGGTICQVEQPEWLGILPSWWEDVLMVPVWGPDPGPEGILESAIVAHINVRSEVNPPADAVTTSVIHFATDPTVAPLPALSDALLRSAHRDAAIPLVLVLPQGALRQTRASLAERLGAFSGDLHSPLVMTEDYEGSWTKAFKAPGGPSTFVMGATGELDWQSTGALDLASLTSALDEHGIAGRRRRSRLLRLALRIGERAPDLIADHVQSKELSLRGLQGRRVLLLFWKSCSMPCIVELCRFRHVHQEGGQQGPVILAIADGEDDKRIDEIRREHALSYPLIPDPHRQIARRYGINCWPTIVSIREDGVLDLIHCGVTHDRSSHASTRV